jgi:methionyl-tRNA formyltransferase
MSDSTPPIRVAFFGTPFFAATALSTLIGSEKIDIGVVVTQPDRRAGRGKRLLPSPVKEMAVANSIPVVQPGHIKKELPSFLESLTAFGEFDIGVVVAFGQILPLEVLHLPKRHCVNVHASLLPRWRGAAPIQRAILAGDRETGVGLMEMEAGLDTGPVFIEERCSIGENETAGSLHDRLSEIGARLLVEHLPAIVSGSLTPTPQVDHGITYAKKIEREESRIDWSLKNQQVYRTINAFSPTPGAFTFLGNTRIKILNATIADTTPNASSSLAPGTILSIEPQGIVVNCGSGAVRLHSLQPAGKKVMSAGDFSNGTALKAGLTFSSIHE